MALLGARQNYLNTLCSTVFDQLGLPDEDVLKKLEFFLRGDSLKGISFDENVDSTIADRPTLFFTLKGLTIHGHYEPLIIVCRKCPEKKLDLQHLGDDLFLKINAFLKQREKAVSKMPQVKAARNLLYSYVSEQIDCALMNAITDKAEALIPKTVIYKKR